MDPPYVGFLPNVSRAGGVRVWFSCCRVTYSILPVSLIWLQSWNAPKRRVNDLITEIRQRCAENAEIERIEVIEQRWIEYSPSPMSCKNLDLEYEEPLKDDLATKVKEWNAFQFTLMDARATFHGYKQKTRKRSVTETTEGKAADGEGAVEFENSKFEASVHSRTDLNDIEKFMCLRSNLKGPALDVISGFSITATNYLEAVKTLRERFDRADLIIQHHIIQIADIKKVTESPAPGLRRQYDKIMLHLRALRAMGKDPISELIESNTSIPANLESFSEFIRKQIDIEEKVTITKKVRSTVVEKCATTTLHGNRSKGTSGKYTTSALQLRATVHDLLIKKDTECKKTDEKTEEYVTRVCLNMNVGTNDGNSSYLNGSLLITRAVICSENGNRRIVYCILDSGAQRSFVKKKIVESMGLSGPKEYITISTLNQPCEHRKLMRVELPLKGIENDIFYVINALYVSHICDKVPSSPPIEEYEHLKGLKLADQFPGEESAQIETYSSKTIFGWVICGKNIPQNRTHLLHCKVDEECKCECDIIKKFWGLEALGIEIQNEFEDEVKFDGERYVVKLPWKTPEVRIPNNYKQTERILQQLEKRLSNNNERAKEYDEVIKNYMEREWIDETEKKDGIPGKTWYLPPHAVYRDDKMTNKPNSGYFHPILTIQDRSPSGHFEDFPANSTALRRQRCNLNCSPFLVMSVLHHPADIITRGTTLKKLKSNRLWWNGPKWLLNENQWPKERLQQKIMKEVQNIIEEERKMNTIVLNVNVRTPPIFDFEKFRNFENMLRVMAYCIRFASICKTSPKRRKLKDLTSNVTSSVTKK
ncbi:hypothetical protein T05_4064 [Trichinella murrelli]|uniref:Peptidase aspartic putative domain-containing protein n=1 Tax=Trichinella murrelli TaxID=144512 RepID=A0A0V0TFX8_9BILA|nr:hypothetical protein T05_4064 [Trichinella murrelli]